MKTSVKAGIDLRPQRSQILVALFGVASAVCAGASFLFLWFRPDYGWILPAAFSIGFGSLSVVCWLRSHVNSDLVGAHPVKFLDQKSGIEFQADSRALSAPQIRDAVAELLQRVAHMKPLPPPDGKVNPDGSPDPSRAQEAQEEVANFNEKNEQDLKRAIETLVGGAGGQISPSGGALAHHGHSSDTPDPLVGPVVQSS